MNCNCGGKVVGMPGQTKKCNFCGAKVRVTKKVVAKSAKKVAIKVVTKSKKTPAKAVKKVAKKRANNAQPSAMA